MMKVFTDTPLANDGGDILLTDGRFVAARDLASDPIPQANSTAPTLDLNSGDTGTGSLTTYIENDAPLRIGSAISVGDADGDMITGATVRITNAVIDDLLGIIGSLPAGITVDPSSTATLLKLVGTATAAAYATALTQIAYSNIGENPRPVSTAPYRFIDVTVTDGVFTSAVATNRVTVFNLNDAPAGSDATYTTGQSTPYVLTADKFGFSDVDGNSFAGVIFTTLPTAGTLYYDSDGPGGAAPITILQGQRINDLAAGHIYYTPAVNGTGTPYASFTFQVVDNGGSAPGEHNTDPTANTIIFNVTPGAPPAPVPHIPVVDLDTSSGGVNDSGSYTENAVPTRIGSSISVFDEDGDLITGATIRIANPIAGDLLSAFAALPAGITIDASSTATTLILVGTASGATWSAALANIGYSNTGDNPAPDANNPYRSIEVVVRDATSESAVATTRILVTNVNDRPTGTDATYTIDQDTSYILTAASFGFSDIDGGVFTSVVFTSLPSNGSLFYDADGPGGATALAVTTGQRISDFTPGHLYFAPVPHGSGAPYTSFTFQVEDDGGDGNGGFGTDLSPNTITFNVTPGPPPVVDPNNHAPVVDLNTGTAGVNNVTTYLESAAPSRIGTAISVVDDEGAPITGAVVAISNAAAGDLLTVIGSLPSGISIDPSSNALVVRLVGAATAAAYATALAQIGYSNTGNNPTVSGTNVNRFIDVTVNDGHSDSAPATVQVTTTGINTAPTGTDAAYSLNQGASYTLTPDKFGFVDSDGNAFGAVKITTLPTHGTLYFDEDGPGGFAPEAVSAGQTIFTSAISLGRLTYVSPADSIGFPYTSFTFQVIDTGGLANGGQNTDQSPNRITFNVVGANSHPTATNLSAAETYIEDTRIRLTAIAITDPDLGDTITATLTLSNVAAGELSVGTSGAVTATFVNGVWTASGALADVNALVSKIQFRPAANFNGNFSIATSVGDGLSGPPITGTKFFTGTAVNDAPSGTSASVSITAGVDHIVAASEFGFSDIDGNAFASVTITTLPVGGRLLLDGVKLITGQVVSAADIAAGKLIYQPAPGATTGSFTFQVHDSGGTANGGIDTDQSPDTLTYASTLNAAANDQLARILFVPGEADSHHDFAAVIDAIVADGGVDRDALMPMVHAEPQHLQITHSDWAHSFLI